MCMESLYMAYVGIGVFLFCCAGIAFQFSPWANHGADGLSGFLSFVVFAGLGIIALLFSIMIFAGHYFTDIKWYWLLLGAFAILFVVTRVGAWLFTQSAMSATDAIVEELPAQE